ncbi:MAG: Gfo/Idh/MocA family oxidoreductase [Alcaligenaceae bacterium]|nr:Gfo/Idh/MocA family oxidoreductase [Alcaligenaceae bacterium SAGV5]MPS54368.1 Gfo/Idh/MocA family oxidoreductase [Alcaligenaceae bacterium SAGV3]MPT60058.1 Gfo/Idh/MocA family oxidoreductase [Alcaligenaceae bacterium]
MAEHRVALIAPSHWHYPMYRPAFLGPDVRIAGIWDPSPPLARQVAAEFDAPVFATVDELLSRSGAGFAFAFGAHADMPAIASRLIDGGMPFSIEKPAGLHGDHIAGIRRAARRADVFVSIPFHYRLSALARALSATLPLPSPDFLHMQCSVHAGSPLRFADSSPWLVEPGRAGGGCLMNLGHHPIDLLSWITGADVVSVQATLSDKAWRLAVEDHASLSLVLSDGTVASLETSYRQPARAADYMDFHISLAHRAFTAKREGERLAFLDTASGASRSVDGGWRFKDYFADYVRATLSRAQAGASPVAGLEDLERTQRVIDAAYLSAKTGRSTVPQRVVSID